MYTISKLRKKNRVVGLGLHGLLRPSFTVQSSVIDGNQQIHWHVKSPIHLLPTYYYRCFPGPTTRRINNHGFLSLNLCFKSWKIKFVQIDF